MTVAVFFDRDGVLNRDHGYVFRWEDWEWMPEAREAIRYLNEHGIAVAIVTNQSGIARGYYGEAEVRALHERVQADLARCGTHIDHIRYCPHHPDGKVAAYRKDCACRKPAPGMIRDILAATEIEAAGSLLIGDKASDLAAAAAAGVPAVLFDGSRSLLDIVTRWHRGALASGRVG